MAHSLSRPDPATDGTEFPSPAAARPTATCNPATSCSTSTAAALAHTAAPEIAQAILNSDQHVAAAQQSDVWPQGASLWWPWAPTPPITYSAPAAGRAGQRADIAALCRAPASSRPWPFPAFEESSRGTSMQLRMAGAAGHLLPARAGRPN